MIINNYIFYIWLESRCEYGLHLISHHLTKSLCDYFETGNSGSNPCLHRGEMMRVAFHY